LLNSKVFLLKYRALLKVSPAAYVDIAAVHSNTCK